MRVAVVGGGISGVATARVLQRFGHEVVVFERGPTPGGVWAVTYPEVRLQNVAEHYRLAEMPWPFAPDLHPTREQILAYVAAVIERFGLDVRVRHEVAAMVEEPAGWALVVRAPEGERRERFDRVVIATGHYTGPQHRVALAGRERFRGEVMMDREIEDLAVLAGRRVAVVGFGKTAVDLATFAAQRGSEVHHVFREPRWLIPRHILGIHASRVLFARISTMMIPSWVHPSAGERLLHTRLRPLVAGFWAAIAGLVRAQLGLHGLHRDPELRRRLRLLVPETSLPYQMRSALALAPDAYFPQVFAGRIEPHRGQPVGLTEEGLGLADGRVIACDAVVLSTGFEAPRFPFLPPAYRALVEAEADGPQLYRHLIDPRIPRVAFAGFNHGFLHVPSAEIGALWLAALWAGDLELPDEPEILRQIEAVRRWKRDHVLFEPSRGCSTTTRFHQYLDVLLGDLGLRARRKSGPLAELLGAYSAADYEGVFAEYAAIRVGRPRRPLPLAT